MAGQPEQRAAVQALVDGLRLVSLDFARFVAASVKGEAGLEEVQQVLVFAVEPE